jgi:Na+-transporting methylmalonyl-CoA/oxaloacetate decarboxylase gamma subunit
MDQAIGIIGQAILVLVGLACVVMLVLLILLTIRGIRRLVRELRTPIMPETDAHIPPSRRDAAAEHARGRSRHGRHRGIGATTALISFRSPGRGSSAR